MRVLGFDLSTVATGWAVVNDGELGKKGTICPVDELKYLYKTKKAAKEIMRDEVVRFTYIVKRASEIIDRTKPDVLVVEDSFMRDNASVLRLLARLSGGVLGYWVEHFCSTSAYLVMASRARAGIGCRGNAKKPEVIQFIRDKYGVIIEDDNEADAFVLAMYGYEKAPTTKLCSKTRKNKMKI